MNTNIFYNLTDDVLFKFVFSHQKFTKDLLNSFFAFIHTNTKAENIQVNKDQTIYGTFINNKIFYGDIIAILSNNEIASLEMYTTFGREEYLKSASYLSRLYGNQLKKGQAYKQAKKVISINFMRGNYHKNNNYLVNDYGFISKIGTPNKQDEFISMYLIRLDLVNKMVYNKSDKRFIKWLKFMNAKSMEELKNIGRNDEIMEETIKYVENFLREEGTTFQDKLDYEKSKSEAEGEIKGEIKGKRLGLIETAKNMLEKGYSLKNISEVTTLNINEIKRISKNIDN